MSFALATARLTSAAWVGAAALFVVTSIHEVGSPHFDSTTRDQLVLLRFPAYYQFGFALVSTALVFGWWARKHPAASRLRMRIGLALLTAALLLMCVDYFFIFDTLVAMISPPGRARAARFQTFHKASEWINAVDVGLCLIAAVLFNWSGGSTPSDRPGHEV